MRPAVESASIVGRELLGRSFGVLSPLRAAAGRRFKRRDVKLGENHSHDGVDLAAPTQESGIYASGHGTQVLILRSCGSPDAKPASRGSDSRCRSLEVKSWMTAHPSTTFSIRGLVQSPGTTEE